MATPHVAGVAALIFGKSGGTPASVRSKLDASVDDLGAAGRDPQFGFGRVNLQKALTSKVRPSRTSARRGQTPLRDKCRALGV